MHWAYPTSDELTLTAIAAAERPRRLDWDANEPEPIYGFSQALAYSSANLGEWAPSFAADFAAQALKGAGWLLGYPALVAVSRGSASPGSALRLDLPIVRWQEPVYALFGQPWMPLLGFIGMLALLLRVTARNGREALAAATLFLALAGYPAVQFALRHVFHLEFIWVLSLLSLPMALREWRRLLPVVPRFALATVSILGAMALAYAMVTHFQQSQLIAKFSALLDLPRTTVALRRETLDDGMVLLRVPVPPAQASLIDGLPDSTNDRIAEMGIENDVRAGGERMLLMLGGATCRADTVTLELRYDHRPHIWQRLDQTLSARPATRSSFRLSTARRRTLPVSCCPKPFVVRRESFQAAADLWSAPRADTVLAPTGGPSDCTRGSVASMWDHSGDPLFAARCLPPCFASRWSPVTLVARGNIDYVLRISRHLPECKCNCQGQENPSTYPVGERICPACGHSSSVGSSGQFGHSTGPAQLAPCGRCGTR